MKSNLLSNSRFKTFRACPRRHHNEYELGYRALHDGDEAFFGTLVHTGLEPWWRCSATGEERIEVAVAAMRKVPNVDPYTLVMAEVMMAGYEYRWGKEPFEVLAVEAVFDMPLVNPDTGVESRTWRLGGKLDVVVRDTIDGRVLVVEHKTSGEDIGAGTFYWRRLRLDSQVSTYFDGARSLGYDVQEVLYDVLGKPTIRPKKATPEESRKYTAKGQLYANQRDTDETPEEYKVRLLEALIAEPDRYFQRAPVVRLEDELNEARADNWATAKVMRESHLAGRRPKNVDACMRFGRPCPFFDVCSGSASLDDPSRFVKLEHVHPELPNTVPTEGDQDERSSS